MAGSPGEPYVDLTGFSSEQAYAFLLPYMTCPSDFAQRERMYAWILAKSVDTSDPSVRFSGHALDRLTEAVGGRIADHHDKAMREGAVAGDMLLMLLAMAAARRGDLPLTGPTEVLGAARPRIEKVGQGYAQFAVSQMYQQHYKTRGGKRLRANPDTVRRHWIEYRNVSHLWAALLILERGNDARGGQAISDGLLLAGCAMALLDKAVAEKLPTGEPILSRAALRILGAPLQRVQPEAMGAAELRAFASFVPRD